MEKYILFLVVLFLISCKSDKESIYGKWKVVSLRIGNDIESADNLFIIIEENGTYIMEDFSDGKPQTDHGTYIKENNHVVLNNGGFEADIILKDSTLEISGSFEVFPDDKVYYTLVKLE